MLCNNYLQSVRNRRRVELLAGVQCQNVTKLQTLQGSHRSVDLNLAHGLPDKMAMVGIALALRATGWGVRPGTGP